MVTKPDLRGANVDAVCGLGYDSNALIFRALSVARGPVAISAALGRICVVPVQKTSVRGFAWRVLAVGC